MDLKVKHLVCTSGPRGTMTMHLDTGLTFHAVRGFPQEESSENELQGRNSGSYLPCGTTFKYIGNRKHNEPYHTLSMFSLISYTDSQHSSLLLLTGVRQMGGICLPFGSGSESQSLNGMMG